MTQLSALRGYIQHLLDNGPDPGMIVLAHVQPGALANYMKGWNAALHILLRDELLRQ